MAWGSTHRRTAKATSMCKNMVCFAWEKNMEERDIQKHKWQKRQKRRKKDGRADAMVKEMQGMENYQSNKLHNSLSVQLF